MFGWILVDAWDWVEQKVNLLQEQLPYYHTFLQLKSPLPKKRGIPDFVINLWLGPATNLQRSRKLSQLFRLWLDGGHIPSGPEAEPLPKVGCPIFLEIR